MDTKPTPPEKDEAPVETVVVPVAVDTAGEGVAESYIASELKKARSGLQRTMIVSLLLIVAIGGYLGYVAYNFKQYLEPASAAEIAATVIDERVELHATDLAAQMQERIPTLIAELPDYAIKELPGYREALENQIETDLTTHCQSVSTQLGEHMDDFLVEHKDNIKDLLATGQDKESVKQLGADLEKEFMKWLQEKPDGGESITDKINKSLVALRDIEKKMAHLSANKNLTLQEKKTRRAIAILSKTVDREVTPLKAGLDEIVTSASATKLVPTTVSESVEPATQ